MSPLERLVGRWVAWAFLNRIRILITLLLNYRRNSLPPPFRTSSIYWISRMKHFAVIQTWSCIVVRRNSRYVIFDTNRGHVPVILPLTRIPVLVALSTHPEQHSGPEESIHNRDLPTVMRMRSSMAMYRVRSHRYSCPEVFSQRLKMGNYNLVCQVVLPARSKRTLWGSWAPYLKNRTDVVYPQCMFISGSSYSSDTYRRFVFRQREVNLFAKHSLVKRTFH